MKIAVLTLGCRTNQAESARIEQLLNANGHQTDALSDKTDICIINTCSVTAKADYQSRQMISRALKANAEVIVTGCYAELNSTLIKEKNKRIKVIGNGDKHNIINVISSSLSCNSLELSGNARQRPIIKVQDGCDNECTYCIVPKARGRSRSVMPEEILREVERYESLGFEEIVISGIHLGMYGKDLEPGYSLAKLLEKLLLKTKMRRIRLSSIEVNELTEDLINVIVEERICKHLHVPLQSGDDIILKRMNRQYTVNEYGNTIESIRKRFDNISIGTDVIVGFPGEFDSNFNNTLKAIESFEFTYLHAFPFSPRTGTKAATMPDRIHDSLKKRRVMLIRDAGDLKKAAFIEKNIGQSHEMIIESIKDTGIFGTTSNYIRVMIPFEKSLSLGRLARIRITGFENGSATGVPVIDPKPSDK